MERGNSESVRSHYKLLFKGDKRRRRKTKKRDFSSILKERKKLDKNRHDSFKSLEEYMLKGDNNLN